MALVAVDGATAAPSDAEWHSFWRGHSVESEIAMADFYGLRHLLLKFLPRHGTLLEAGCGLGRFVFYLRALGLRVVGCERLLPVLQVAREWALRASPGSAGAFGAADVRRLPLRDDGISGYISLGVIEHFSEGPAGAIAEAYRVLQPGGVAIIEVPNARAFDGYVHRTKRALGTAIGRRYTPATAMLEEPLTPSALGTLLRQAGFTLLFCNAVDLIYPAWSIGLGSRWYRALHRAECTALGGWGGLAVAIGLKRAATMACFVCGSDAAGADDFAVAFCARCRRDLPVDVRAGYTPARVAMAHWQSLDCGAGGRNGRCSVCGAVCRHDEHFGDWGFAVPVCGNCVRQPAVNLALAQGAVKRVWRPRVAP